MLSLAVASGIAGNVIGGPLAERIGTSAGLSRGIAAWSVLMLAAAATGQPLVFAILWGLGFGAGGVLDTVMNVSATAALGPRPGRLARFHAFWNSGALVSAAAVALLLARGVSWRWPLAAIALLGFPLAIWVSRSPLPAAARGESHHPLASFSFVWRERIVMIAIALLACAVVEGGVDTWGVLFLRSQLALGVLTGAGAYLIGQALAVSSRFGLGPLVGRLPAHPAAAVGAALSGAGLLLESSAPTTLAAVCGLALGVVGVALCWPLLMAAGSRGSARPGLAVGGLTTAAYGGFLLGPLIVGGIAGGIGLRAALWALAAVALIPAATLLPRRPRSRKGSL